MSVGPVPIECDGCGAIEHADTAYHLPRGWCSIEVKREGILGRARFHACSYECLVGMMHLRGGPAYTQRRLEAWSGC